MGKTRKLNGCVLALLLTSTFSIGVEYSLLMPTVWKYVRSLGGSKTMLGIVLASFSLTRTIMFPVVGHWSDRRPMKEPYITLFVLGSVGMLVYGLAGGFDSLAALIIGRAIAGIGAASTTLNQTYIARGASADQRTKLLSMTRGFAMMGVACGPALNLLLVQLDKIDACVGRFCLDSMTGAGYIMFIVNFVLAGLFGLMFQEPAPQLSQTRPSSPVGDYSQLPSSSINRVSDVKSLSNVLTSQTEHENSLPTSTGCLAAKMVIIQRAGWFCLLVSFIGGFEITALETALTPITHDQYRWGAEQNSYLFAGITGMALIAVISTIILDKKGVSSRNIIAVACVFCCIGMGLAVGSCGGPRVPLWGLLTFGSFLVFGLVLQSSPAIGVYSTMIGDFDKGIFMGYSQIVMGIARFLGPLLAGITLEHWKDHYLMFGILAGSFVTIPISMPFVWHMIVKHPETETDIDSSGVDYLDVPKKTGRSISIPEAEEELLGEP